MSAYFDKVKSYLVDRNLKIVTENAEGQLLVVENEEEGIRNLVLVCDEPIIILEQLILDLPAKPGDLFKRLLQMNRTLVHGAFCLDEEAKRVIFRDTLQLANLDRNELEASIRALSMALAENGNELLSYIKRD